MLENPNPMFNEEWSARKWAVLQCQVRRLGIETCEVLSG